MQHTPIESIPNLPAQLSTTRQGADCTTAAPPRGARLRPLRRHRENARPDLFLKTAASGTLAHEARMDDTFHMLGIGPEVLEYLPGSES